MDELKRRTRFEGRIQLEREFLTPVNSFFGDVAPLSGMTADAIESWISRATKFCNEHNVLEIGRILREASTRAELLADNSKDVFEPDRNTSSSAQDLRVILDKELARIQRELVHGR